MIDEIVEMILKEARGRKNISRPNAIFIVQTEIESKLVKIRHDLRNEERRKKEDENKG